MTYQIRELTSDDAADAYRLGSIAFGYVDRPMPPVPTFPPGGRITWGAFDEEGRLVAKAVDRAQSHWFGGRLVPGCGIAGVAVAPEHRGHGLSTTLLTTLMTAARDRGAAVGALFDTTPWPYRRLGWEEVGILRTVALPTLALASLRTPGGHAVRPATEADVPALQDLFRALAQAGCAVMDRAAPISEVAPADVLAAHDGTTVVVDNDGTIVGFCAWDRTGSYRSEGTLYVEDLITVNPAATTALLAMIGGWAAVAPNLILSVPVEDPAFLAAAMGRAAAHTRDPWMLRVIDAPAAIAARGWPAFVSGAIDLTIEDPICPWNEGTWRLSVADGNGRLESGGTGAVKVGPRALAVLYAGAGSPDLLRRAGLVTGGDAKTDAFLQVIGAGPAPTLRDYF